MKKILHKYKLRSSITLNKIVLSIFSCVTISFLWSPSTMATSGTNSMISDTKQDTETFSYELESRRDPFVPFLSPKSTSSSVDLDEIVDTAGELSGMQVFEPGQLNLVALLERDNVRYAMVEDVTGKGYILSQGIKIGRRGVVKDIIPNKVLIEETAFTRAGKKIVTQVVMVLKKEGEE
ncbi:pilus assembly protein PilP [Desulfopila sp. IMCC35008]|uniref:pilus assembly protein PilP n=1 Tax=Desulfopila sp. IMCC35008 TaxID=2653858 RepID=UPI0013D36688|nr:pilus assembly protein PilP [Desulfopila sp. IMCC35008]